VGDAAHFLFRAAFESLFSQNIKLTNRVTGGSRGSLE